MARTENSVVINAPYDTVFDVTNDIERWPELFEEYKEAKILRREGDKITFELTNKEGNSWRSSRILDKEHHQCTAEREQPLFPFKYMHLKWQYEDVTDGVKMTWIQEFEMDPKAKYTNDQAANLINKHSAENMQRIKDIIEQETNRK